VTQCLAAVGTDILRQKLILRALHLRVTGRSQAHRLAHIFKLGAEHLFLARTVSIDRYAFAPKLVG
jgi:hypothetical protein